MTQALALSDGRSIPQLGFGLWQVPKDETGRLVAEALAAGYRLIDGAAAYGNEAGMGEGLRASGLDREAVFLTSKVWNSDQGAGPARAAIEASLARIGVDWLDLVLIHWPCPRRDLFVETWRALIEARQAGLVRSIGVSNFTPAQIARLEDETGVLPVLNQIELNPRLQQAEARAFHAAKGIVTQSWTPLGKSRSFEAPQIAGIAQRLGKTPAQVILRWHLQLGCSVIPRSTNRGRIAQNAALWDFSLTEADMAAIASLDAGERCGPDPMVFEG